MPDLPTPDLEPCPFCGGAAVLGDAYLAQIMRTEQGASCPACVFSLPIAAWNTRAIARREAEMKGVVDELRGALELAGNILADQFRNGFAFTPVGDEPQPYGTYYIGEGVMPAIAQALSPHSERAG